MLSKLQNGTYMKATYTERREFIDEAIRMIRDYGWKDRTVMPWAGIQMKITDIIGDLIDYDDYTNSSKVEILELANGLAEIMNAWEEHAKEPKVRIRVLKNGKVKEVSKDFAEMMIEDGLAEIA